MTQTLRGFLSRLTTVQGSLAITDPVRLAVKKAYTYTPKRSQVLEVPAFLNSYTLTREYPQFGPHTRWEFYTIESAFACYDADTDQAADIATAFLTAYLDAIEAERAGDFTSTIQRWAEPLRGADPTLVVVEWAGKTHIGWRVLMDIKLANTKSYV